MMWYYIARNSKGGIIMFNELFDKILEKNPELKEEKSIKRDIAISICR